MNAMNAKSVATEITICRTAMSMPWQARSNTVKLAENKGKLVL
jgi:hypothetical protein